MHELFSAVQIADTQYCPLEMLAMLVCMLSSIKKYCSPAVRAVGDRNLLLKKGPLLRKAITFNQLINITIYVLVKH